MDEKLSPPVPRRQSNGVTIKDVAAAAGVSIGTVSRVMNDRNWVSPETRKKVTMAIERVGFIANPRARALTTQRSRSIALVLGAPAPRLFDDPNYAVILQETTEALAEADYSLVLASAADDAARRRVASYIRARHVDGAILLSPSEPERDVLIDTLESGIVPVVVCGNPFPAKQPLRLIIGDEVSGCMALGEHFRNRGYSRTAAVAAYADMPGPADRLRSFERGLGRAVQHLENTPEYSRRAGYDACRRLLASGTDFDSIFATSDLLAVGVLDALHEAGVAVPDDIGVAGFDDSELAVQANPPLTTVRRGHGTGAQEMVDYLLRTLDGQDPELMSSPSELVVRNSTR